jgi:hypothetical protein
MDADADRITCCNQCKQPLIEIDNHGERLKGCLTCNLWSIVDRKLWKRLSEEDRRLEFLGGLFAKARDLDIAHVVFSAVLHWLDMDYVADHRHLEWSVDALAYDCKSDRRMRRPAHLLHGLL